MRALKTAFAAAVFCAQSPAVNAQTTRGDVWDKNAAYEVSRCTRQYLGRLKPGERPQDYWQMCLEVISEQSGRPLQNIKQRVIEQQKRDVFQRG